MFNLFCSSNEVEQLVCIFRVAADLFNVGKGFLSKPPIHVNPSIHAFGLIVIVNGILSDFTTSASSLTEHGIADSRSGIVIFDFV